MKKPKLWDEDGRNGQSNEEEADTEEDGRSYPIRRRSIGFNHFLPYGDSGPNVPTRGVSSVLTDIPSVDGCDIRSRNPS